MSKPTDVRITGAELYLLPVRTRVPLKFGRETLTSVTCARVRLTVRDGQGRSACGWGETPLSVQWVWPSRLGYQERYESIVAFTTGLVEAWAGFEAKGHPMEISHDFLQTALFHLLAKHNQGRQDSQPLPYLAALLCCSPFDIALHDAYGQLHGLDVYETYNEQFMSDDLSAYLKPAEGAKVDFLGKYPADFLLAQRPRELPAWHLVGGMDPLEEADLTAPPPDDGYPTLLTDWIRRDGLTCLKVKLRGDDMAWDYDRLVRVGRLAQENGAYWLSTDFNCTVTDPAYVNDVLDRLLADQPRTYGMILYVEQPFPYDLEASPIDVRSVSARKPLFMDESAHDWRLVRLGRSLGWSGVALKTCKTQTGAILSACWAKAHGMTLMVQDLTNPMLAQIPHVILAGRVGTIMGVETNAMQFYPAASLAEEKVHPGLYRRRDGKVRLDSLRGAGFGYRVDEIARELPEPTAKVDGM